MATEAKCPICGSDKWLTKLVGGDFQVDWCARRCIGKTSPAPEYEKIATLATGEKMDAGITSDIDSGHFRLANDILVDLRKHLRSGRLLDIGCGWGHLLKLAQDEGFEAEGIDASDAAVEFAWHEFGIKPLHGCFPSNDLDSKSYDIAVFNHVLEHLDDPIAAMIEAKRILKKDGIVAAAVPNYDSLARKLRNDKWQGIQPYQHIWQFSVDSVIYLMQNAGFDVISIKKTNLAYPRGPRSLQKWMVLRSTLLVADILHLGDNMVVLGRKSA